MVSTCIGHDRGMAGHAWRRLWAASRGWFREKTKMATNFSKPAFSLDFSFLRHSLLHWKSCLPSSPSSPVRNAVPPLDQHGATQSLWARATCQLTCNASSSTKALPMPLPPPCMPAPNQVPKKTKECKPGRCRASGFIQYKISQVGLLQTMRDDIATINDRGMPGNKLSWCSH